MPKATDLVSSLFSVTSPRDVPFCRLQQLQCLPCGSTKAYLYLLSVPTLYHISDDLRYTHYSFSERLE